MSSFVYHQQPLEAHIIVISPSTVTVFPQIDHDPFPQEGIEYTVWGADSPTAPFPDGTWARETVERA